MTSPVIDLSHHNPTPNWARIAEAGVTGVILKATEAYTYVDPTWEVRRSAARRAGLAVATYHFLRPGDMRRQMAHYLRTIAPEIGERVVIDHEDTKVSLADLKQAVAAIRANRPDLQITIYSGHLIKEQVGTKHDPVLAETSLWIAQYTKAAEPSWPRKTWPNWSLWQWTDKETVPGISAPVDGNRWNGGEAALRRWLAPAQAVPEPVPPVPPLPEPGFPVVALDITTPPDVTVSVTINGNVVVAGPGE